MNTASRIIWIWWNISRPNPRLPAYIIPSLIESISDNVTSITLVSSLDASKKNAPDIKAANEIEFNTLQKIRFLTEFRNQFFPKSPSVQFEPHEESNEIDEIQWIELWNELEKTCTSNEKDYLLNTLTKLAGKDSIDAGKIYSVRHAFWFFDIWFQSPLWQLESIGWPQESFFNFIREKIYTLAENSLERIFSRDIVKSKVNRIIHPYDSKVIQYWDATRKTGNNRVSLEYPLESSWDISNHYNGRLEKKSHLDTDITLIHQHITPQDYWDFWCDFSNQYHQEHSNI